MPRADRFTCPIRRDASSHLAPDPHPARRERTEESSKRAETRRNPSPSRGRRHPLPDHRRAVIILACAG
jgi:hypothetical protein